MKQKIIFKVLSIFMIGIFSSFAQSVVKGNVKGKDGANLASVNVVVKETKKSTMTGFDGNFSIDAASTSTLVFTSVGYETKEVSVAGRTQLDVVLQDSNTQLDEVVLIGSRNPKRTVTESAVPIDVISLKDLSSQGAQTNLNQIMNMVAPSFTSNTQTVADGTDHIDPAQLRGLGPDQVLVLVNGKRRHTSSLVNINGTPGRGAVGTDLNAIPAFAIDKIEVLRDGASAQYGSDAIAGVINLNLKKNTGKVEINAFSGANFSKGSNDHNGGSDGANYQFDLNYGRDLGKAKSFINLTASAQFRDATSRAKDVTGQLFNGFNAVEERARRNGVNLTSLFSNTLNTTPGFYTPLLNSINTYASQVGYFTPATLAAISAAATASSIPAMRTALNIDITDSELAYRGLTRRDFNMRVGQSSLQSTQFFLNAAYPINDKLELYTFAGTSYRTGESAGFYRRPSQARAYTGLYPNGFLPEIHSTINDLSAAAGLRGKIFGNWNFDLSNTFGRNSFDYGVENTSNASLRLGSPVKFDAGGLAFRQNTTNLDFNQRFGSVNVALGLEYRYENFQIKAGQPESYNLYDINGNVAIAGTTAANLIPTDFFGAQRPNGSQVFPGFRPENAKNESRNSKAAYADLEYDITKKWLISGAIRFENYSDFGSTTNYKFATRYKVTSNFNLRGAVSTGFRAPSLHQSYFNSTATQFVGGVPFEVRSFSNDSQAAIILGIPKLKQEESQSASVGFTSKIPAANLTITADAYIVKIKDRIQLTDQFARPAGTFAAGSPQQLLQSQFDLAGATAATFFANAIDTESKGIDIVVSHKANLASGVTLRTDASATFSNTKSIGDIKGTDLLRANNQINRFYSETSRVYLEEAVPRVKGNLINTLTIKKLDIFLRNVYFGQVTDPNTADVNGDGIIEGKVVNGQAVEIEHPIWGSRVITDLSVGYAFTKNIKFVIGANNIFDIYPDENLGPIAARRPNGVDANGNVTYGTATPTVDLSNANQFVYSRNVSQFGQNGRFVFARLNFKF